MRGVHGPLIPERTCVQPWGPDPPPAPIGTPRAEVSRVRSAWGAWRHFRPWYFRERGVVTAQIDLKGNGWRGTGSGETEEQEAWNALQDCILNWRRDIRRHTLGARLWRWIARRR